MNMPAAETLHNDEDPEQQQKRQQLINFGHTQWGFNNWSWTVTKQDLDFVDFTNGKYCAGVCAYVSVTVKSFDIHRENIGYATSLAVNKGFAIYKSRKCAVTNALRETLLSFGGSVATELAELLESHKAVTPPPAPHPAPDENNQNAPNKMADAAPKNSPLNRGPRKEDCPANNRALQPQIKNAPVATAHPMPAPALAPRPPRPPVPPAPLRPNSNVSFVLQPVMPPLYPARLPPPAPPVYPNYFEYAGPWHFAYETYDRPHGNVNLNFNAPPKNLVVNGRGSVECKNACRQEGEPVQFAPQQGAGCWIKPTIFYDGFWTEQKVKKWVAEQVEKQFPEEASHKAASPDAPKS
ncbi:uncharacterized protein LOC114359124 isoform X2 [Ostrinia furnacalis]|nr:uncharacterized protein LOC114359124 isoform X2 [Ostrinia furnacalis]XP_028169183.1 uncharacterized protein LOC114359124 isoform X2 [Ostrinia furnacalis]